MTNGLSSTPEADRATGVAFRIVLVIVATGCALAFLHAVRVAWAVVPIDYNEGWNAYHAADAMAGRPLYPASPSMMFNNYPPLSFYVVGAIGNLLGDNIFAGRLVSLIAVLAIAGSIAAWLFRQGTSVRGCIFAALFFPAVLLAFTRYVGMDDPQLLGHALGTAGLLLIVRKDRTAAALFAAALLMTLAVFIKHILIVQPLAALIWLARENRRDALRFAVCGVLLGTAGLALADWTLQVDLLRALFLPREYRLGFALVGAGKMLAAGAVPIAATVLLYRTKTGDSGVAFVAIYLAIAVLAGVLFSGGAGVDSNATFDAIIAGSLAIGLILRELRPRPDFTTGFALACLLPFAAAVVIWARTSWLLPSWWLSPLQAQQEATRSDIVFLAKDGDPVFCETLALCYWAGRSPAVDVFSYSQAVVAGKRSEEPLVGLIDARRFRAVQVSSIAGLPFSQALRDTLMHRYRIDHSDSNGVFLVPR